MCGCCSVPSGVRLVCPSKHGPWRQQGLLCCAWERPSCHLCHMDLFLPTCAFNISVAGVCQCFLGVQSHNIVTTCVTLLIYEEPIASDVGCCQLYNMPDPQHAQPSLFHGCCNTLPVTCTEHFVSHSSPLLFLSHILVTHQSQAKSPALPAPLAQTSPRLAASCPAVYTQNAGVLVLHLIMTL
jgi:hypothetical protein